MPHSHPVTTTSDIAGHPLPRSWWSLLLFIAVLLPMLGCNGPAHPERDGRTWLERNGYQPPEIEAVLERKTLAPETVARLSVCASADVRHLLGCNPTLSTAQLDVLMRDTNDYARAGTAGNPTLTLEQMERLMRDDSHTVYSSLASNPAVPEPLLLKLRAERDFSGGLISFALNPKCPAAIVQEIERSNDGLAKHWLEQTRKRQQGAP